MVTLLLAPCSNHEEDRSPLIIPRHIAKSGAKMSKLNIRTAERRKKRAMSMPEEEGMVRRKPAAQRLRERLHLRREAALRQMFRIGFSGNKRVQDGTVQDAKHVCDNVRELDVRLQQLVRAVCGLDPIPDEALPMSREIAQVADRWRRNEARANEPCARRFAIHSQFFTSVFRPGTALMW